MLNQMTMERLRLMKLRGMPRAFEEQADNPAMQHLSFEERFGLIEIGDVGGGEDEPKGVAEGVAGNMDFGGEAGAGAAHCLGHLASRRVGAMGVHAHRSAVDHQVLVVAVLGAQPGQNRRPQAVGSPSTKPVVGTLP